MGNPCRLQLKGRYRWYNKPFRKNHGYVPGNDIHVGMLQTKCISLKKKPHFLTSYNHFLYDITNQAKNQPEFKGKTKNNSKAKSK